MKFEQAPEIANAAVFVQGSRHFDDVEAAIVVKAWQS
jgi:uncharacterized protein YunC (DUF1805 family)